MKSQASYKLGTAFEANNDSDKAIEAGATIRKFTLSIVMFYRMTCMYCFVALSTDDSVHLDAGCQTWLVLFLFDLFAVEACCNFWLILFQYLMICQKICEVSGDDVTRGETFEALAKSYQR